MCGSADSTRYPGRTLRKKMSAERTEEILKRKEICSCARTPARECDYVCVGWTAVLQLVGICMYVCVCVCVCDCDGDCAVVLFLSCVHARLPAAHASADLMFAAELRSKFVSNLRKDGPCAWCACVCFKCSRACVRVRRSKRSLQSSSQSSFPIPPSTWLLLLP